MLVLSALACAFACSESEDGTSSGQNGTAADSNSTSATASSVSSSTLTSATTANSTTAGRTTSVGSAMGAGGTSAANVGQTSAGGSGGASSTLTGVGAAGVGGGGSTATGGGNGGGPGGCSEGDYILCEDFESTEIGEIPEGWTKHGDEIAVADDAAFSGQRSLKADAIPVWERRIYHDAALLGNAHWGRIFYRVELPVPDAFVHSTLVALSGDGPRNGASEYRVVDTVKQAVDTPDVGSLHQFLYNVQPEDSGEFAREGPYDQAFDAEWHCAEYRIDASDQSYALFIDGAEELSFEDGAGEYDRSDIPDSFAELRIGWINYQEAPPGFTAWIDDIAFAEERIGCSD